MEGHDDYYGLRASTASSAKDVLPVFHQGGRAKVSTFAIGEHSASSFTFIAM